MPSEKGKITITTEPGLFPVELLDQQLRLIERSYGRLDADVEPGLYVARCEVGGPAVERLVKVAQGQTVPVNFSRLDIEIMPSPTPVIGTVSSHEFYTEPVWRLAKDPPLAVLGSGARLVLFATRPFAKTERYDSQNDPLLVHWAGLQILNQSGELMIDLPGDDSRSDGDRLYGRAGFSVEVNPGGYFLKWPDSESDAGRSPVQPLWLSQNWTTFVFAGAFGACPTPLRNSVSIHMAETGTVPMPQYDDGSDRVNSAAELALASLRTGRRQLSNEHVSYLLHQKFKNPMLGLLGAHMLLQQSNPASRLVGEVIDNLRNLLGKHPDVAALEVLSTQLFDLPWRREFSRHVSFPPMLRDGLLALDRAGWRSARTGPGPSLTVSARLARLRLLSEGPWTIFWDKLPNTAAYVSPEFRRREQMMAAVGRPMRPFEIAVVAATVEAKVELQAYLDQLRERRGQIALNELRVEHLSWTGLSPLDVREVLALFKKRNRSAGTINERFR